MQPEKYKKEVKKPKRQTEQAEDLGCIVSICEVCSNPIIITSDDAVFIIENDLIECDYCEQLNPITEDLKEAAAELL